MAIFHTTSQYKNKVINGNKRFIGKFLENALHPKWLSLEDIPEIQEGLIDNEWFFIRKVKIHEEKELIDWMDEERRNERSGVFENSVKKIQERNM
jgi:hypothetical protein